MVTPLEIAGRRIGPGEPCFIIAEAGVNHNGDLELARQLVTAAREAGADAVKFQTWITEKLVTAQAPAAAYQRENVPQAVNQFALLKALELSQPQFRQLQREAQEQGILFLSTPDEEESTDFLDALGVPAFKVGSAELTNLPFLRHIAAKGRPVLLSTGMGTLGEVELALDAVRTASGPPCALLHCVSAYPAQPADCNLRAMETLTRAFGCPVGFSDHTLGTEVALAAVARGACLLEKHLTLDKALPGPDHRASLEPHEFGEMVRAVRRVESALGDGVKRPTLSEMETRRVVRKVVVAAHSLAAGQTLTAADLTLRRAADGLAPDALSQIVGRQVRRDLAADTVITGDLLQ